MQDGEALDVLESTPDRIRVSDVDKKGIAPRVRGNGDALVVVIDPRNDLERVDVDMERMAAVASAVGLDRPFLCGVKLQLDRPSAPGRERFYR